jgi:hypothetical protein
MYMYSVFQRAMQTDKGKAIVRSYEATHDAQKVYKELYDYCSKSTRAVFDSSTMQSYTSSTVWVMVHGLHRPSPTVNLVRCRLLNLPKHGRFTITNSTVWPTNIIVTYL